ncbi:MAG: hypothetical protein JSR85_00390 [Proteobacteria bacterium]|nr:hypothetical protein [Pseudomonadota bacterium]
MNTYNKDFFRAEPVLANSINNIYFTPREVDILTCILQRNSAKKIASLLLISPKTVENHIQNIMKKIRCNARESIIDFLENTKEAFLLKQHYPQLLLKIGFESALQEIATHLKLHQHTCVLIYDLQQRKNIHLLLRIKSDLQLTGLTVKIHEREEIKEEEELVKDLACSRGDFFLCALPEVLQQKGQAKNIPQGEINKKNGENPRITFLMLERKGEVKPIKHISLILDINSQSPFHYYSFFYETLNCFCSCKNLKAFIKKNKSSFFQQHQSSLLSFLAKSSRLSIKKHRFFPPKFTAAIKSWPWLQRRPKVIVSIVLILISALCVVFLRKSSLEYVNQALFLFRGDYQPIRSDLFLLKETALLERPALLHSLQTAFHNQHQEIKMVALTGIGGAGKTTLARQYARQLNAAIVWEINADSKKNIWGCPR